jgi:hypothetical protein
VIESASAPALINNAIALVTRLTIFKATPPI